MARTFLLLVVLTSLALPACRNRHGPPSGSLLFHADSLSNDLYLVNADGTGLTQLTDSVDNDTAGAFSPDGTLIAYRASLREDGANGVYVMSSDGSDQRLVTGDDSDNDRSTYFVSWSSKGRLALTSVSTVMKSWPANWSTVDVDGDDPVDISYDNTCPDAVDWSPDGDRLVLSQCGEEHPAGMLIIDDEHGLPIGIIVDGDPRLPSSPKWSPNGVYIAFLAREPDAESDTLFLINADGGSARSLYHLPDGLASSSLRWSPDASRLALATGKEIVIVSIAGGGSRTLTTGEAIRYLSWSPDGEQIAYVSEHDGAKLYVIDSEGGEPAVIAEPVSNSMISWSPVGEQILFSANRERRTGAYWTAADGSRVRQIDSNQSPATPPVADLLGACRHKGSSSWCLSPDEKSEAMVDLDANVLMVRNIASRSVERITVDEAAFLGGKLAWSPDGANIAVYAGNYEEHALYVVDVSTEEAELVSSDAGGTGSSIAWAPDGAYIYYTKGVVCRYDCIPGILYRVRPDGTGEERVVDMRVDAIYGFVP